jgi:hypothetical protein
VLHTDRGGWVVTVVMVDGVDVSRKSTCKYDKFLLVEITQGA